MTKGPYLFDEFLSSDLEETVSPYLTPSSRSYGKYVRLKASLTAAFCLLCAFIFSFFHPPLSYLFLVLVYFFGGTRALIDTIEDLRRLHINIDVLMTLAAFLSILINSALEGGLLLVLFSLSGAMEDAVERRSKSALYRLHQIAPAFAQVLSPTGVIYEKSLREIPVNTSIIIRPGDIVPLDGTILQGSSFVNFVHLTGESEPLSKTVGDALQAGCRNLDGALVLKVTKTSAESTLSRIMKLIEDAQETKPRVQKFLDRFSRTYATTIIALSFLFVLILPWILGIPFTGYEGSIYRGLAFLIAASPCAIIIATPTAYLSAISACAKKGVLLKGGVSLDALAKCTSVAFDKTGTLTTGKLRCVDFQQLAGELLPLDEALSIAATLERVANHPIAKAITAYASERKILSHELLSFKAIPGYGLEGKVALKNNPCSVFIGHIDYITTQTDLPAETLKTLKRYTQSHSFPLCVLLIHESLFVFTFVDELRPQLKETLLSLKQTCDLKLLMLTGDHKQSAEFVAQEAGIDEVHFDLRPEDKLRIISKLSENASLAMVGDGINDAPALARATVGISMGQIGSDTAIEASDIVLLKDDLSLVGWTHKKAKATLHIVKENLTLALGVILLATTPALLGFIPLWLAVILHEGGTVIVGLNSLRLLKK
ncbi:MAG: cation-translocating P-type ATPase [Chlamydiae bacterium]|nr:cation-translocating P-type ATPase [Chlamydiota bacterium]